MAMTSREAVDTRVGKPALLSVDVEGIRILVTVLDHKRAYGRDRYLVSPFSGDGDGWVEGTRLTFDVG